MAVVYTWVYSFCGSVISISPVPLTKLKVSKPVTVWRTFCHHTAFWSCLQGVVWLAWSGLPLYPENPTCLSWACSLVSGGSCLVYIPLQFRLSTPLMSSQKRGIEQKLSCFTCLKNPLYMVSNFIGYRILFWKNFLFEFQRYHSCLLASNAAL